VGEYAPAAKERSGEAQTVGGGRSSSSASPSSKAVVVAAPLRPRPPVAVAMAAAASFMAAVGIIDTRRSDAPTLARPASPRARRALAGVDEGGRVSAVVGAGDGSPAPAVVVGTASERGPGSPLPRTVGVA